MLGLFDTLRLGARALQAQQMGVEIAGQNLANINNPAYARQRLDLQTSLTVQSPFGPQGTGVQVIGIQQLRNSLLDAQIVGENSVGGYWTSQQTALTNAQTMLGEFLSSGVSGASSATDNGTSLSDQLNALFSAFQSVATDPTSLAQRQGLITQAQSLAAGLNQASQNLTSVNNSLNTSVTNDVASANQLLSDIASLNAQITRTEAVQGGTANDLRDLRQQDLENLANLVNFTSSTAADGTVSISINGNSLVTGGQLVDSLQTYDSGGGQLLVQTANTAVPLTLTGGSIQGSIAARDGALQTLRNNLDSLASALITQVNSVYSAGYDLNGNTGANFFTGTDAATIGVNSALSTDPSLVQAAGSAGAPGDNTVVLALAQLGQQPIGSLNNQTFSGSYSQLVGSFGASLANANDQVTNYGTVNTMLLNQRSSVSGVSIEEEMANLITFQNAYQASSKIITTVDQMLQTLVNMKST